MKKFLAILGALGLSSTSIMGVIACTSETGPQNNDPGDDNNKPGDNGDGTDKEKPTDPEEEILVESIDLGTIISVSQLIVNEKSEAGVLEALDAYYKDLHIDQIKVSFLPERENMVAVLPIEGSTKYTGHKIITIILEEHRERRELSNFISIREMQIEGFELYEERVKEALVENNPLLDIQHVKLRLLYFDGQNDINNKYIAAYFSVASIINSTKYKGDVTISYKVRKEPKSLTYFDYKKTDYSDEQLYEEYQQALDWMKSVEYYYYQINDWENLYPQESIKKISEFLIRGYMKYLSLLMIFFEKDYLTMDEVDGKIVVTPMDYKNIQQAINLYNHTHWNLSRVVKKAESFNFTFDKQLENDTNDLILFVDYLKYDQLVKKDISFLRQDHLLSTDEDELTLMYILNAIHDFIKDQVGEEVVRGVDYVVGEIKHDKETGKLLGQYVPISATKTSKILKGSYLLSFKKDLTFLREDMMKNLSWDTQEDLENNKKYAIKQINRWIDGVQSEEDGGLFFDYGFVQSPDGDLMLMYNDVSKIVYGWSIVFKIKETNPIKKQTIDWETIHVKLDEQNSHWSDQEIKEQVVAALQEKLNINVQVGVDFDFVEEVVRDQQTGKLLAQQILVKAKKESVLIEGVMGIYLKKDFTYLNNLLTWDDYRNYNVNKLIVDNEINRWTYGLLKGYDYYYEFDVDGVLTLKFNPGSLLISGPELKWIFN